MSKQPICRSSAFFRVDRAVSTITALQDLSRDELIQIMSATEGSVVAKQQALFGLHGIDLQFAPDALAVIADQAVALGTGARGLKRAVLRALDPVDYRLPELEADGVRKVIITSDVILQGKEPLLGRDPAAGCSPAVSARELRRDARSVPRRTMAYSRSESTSAQHNEHPRVVRCD